MRTVLFVPGFKENRTSRDYVKTISGIKSRGYAVEFIDIDWGRTKTVTDWVGKLNREYSKYKPAEAVLAGFSFGAVTALIVAARTNPVELWLFSLSAAFAEDLSKLKESHHRIIGERRIKAFTGYNFHELAQKILCKTLLFIGGKEARAYPFLKSRVSQANKLIKHSRQVIIPGAGHDVTDESYVQAIVRNI